MNMGVNNEAVLDGMARLNKEFKYEHGTAVMRCEPFHIGHKRIIDKMLEECKQITFVLGSIDKRDNEKNPFTFHDRKKMIRNIYIGTEDWKRMRVLGIPDINDDMKWAYYVLNSVKDHYVDNLEIPEETYIRPDMYYAGSAYDARWFKEEKIGTTILNRTDQNFPYVSATMIRDLCKYGDSRWKLYVPEVNHPIVQKWVDWIKWDRI